MRAALDWSHALLTEEDDVLLATRNGKAIRYGIGVGRQGFTWSGTEQVSRKAEWPDWTPPAEMIERQPYLPRFMAGGPGNPMGARALYLGATVGYGFGSVNVDGSVPIRDLNRAMDWNLPDEEATTIAGLVIHEARAIPDAGQIFNFHGFRFQVLRKSRNRITALKIAPLSARFRKAAE